MKKKEVQLTMEFKTQATKAIFAITFFVLTYLIILLLALILTAACIAGGFLIIATRPMFITIALGVGLASMGILILIFLLKFIFTSHKLDRTQLMEINESQEPKLFDMIKEIVLEVGTVFPNKVYLSSDVNASVFYDSNFWSMFLPIKKNLQIGMGLINTVTREELKAILSHEFGHFSQKTMKVGSYVYNLNQIIFNLLYDNESYERLIQRWGNVSGYFSIFVAIALNINKGIQWVLRKLYEIVNKNYMGLSREMEFHADEIAASITGYEPLKNSLLRMALSDNSFNNVLSYYDNKISENIKSENIFRDQSAVFYFFAAENNFELTNKLPNINLEEQSKFDKSKLVIKDQWASHPSINDRIIRLEKTGYSSDKNSDVLANELFTNIIDLQERLTSKIFEGVSYQAEVKNISSSKFIEEFKQEVLSNSFAKSYNGYYDNKNPICFELNAANSSVDSTSLDDLYSDEKVDLVYSAIALNNDIEVLKNISNNLVSIKTFDYDGIRYKKENASDLIEELTIELENNKKKIDKNDVDIYHYFKRIEKEQNKPNQLERIYNDFFEFDLAFNEKFEIYNQLFSELQFVTTTTPYEQIKANFDRIKPIEESLKEQIGFLLSDPILVTEISNEIKQNLEKYTSKTWQYFNEGSYFDDNLNTLYSAMHNYSFLLSRKYFLLKKALLKYQEGLME